MSRLFLACLCFTSASALAQSSSKFPALPDAITSFGAATTNDGHLYVYGGHMGAAHKYYKEGQGNTLLRLNLNKPTKWEKLATGPRLQGLAMVTDGKLLYRIGGFSALNSEGEESELRSQTSVASFNPAVGTWKKLADLPEPRSSFDAVVHRDQLYVIGGWNMQPDEKTWSSTAYVANLKQTPLVWKKLPTPPFRRRAVSLAALGDSVYVIGGMQEEGGPTRKVSVFNTKTSKWSDGPELTGDQPMAGFGSSSFTIGNRLFTSTYEGKVLELSRDGQSWSTFTSLEEGRFFHRMVPMNNSALLIISGANMSVGKYDDVIVVPIKKRDGKTASVK